VDELKKTTTIREQLAQNNVRISKHSHTRRQESVPVTEMAMLYKMPLRQTEASKTEANR